jgi:hypothetical protein
VTSRLQRGGRRLGGRRGSGGGGGGGGGFIQRRGRTRRKRRFQSFVVREKKRTRSFFSAPSAPFLPRDDGHTPYLLHIWEIIIYMRNYYLHRHPLVAKVVREVQQRQHGLVGEHKERRRVHS